MQEGKPHPEAENAGLRRLLEQPQPLTRDYDEKLTEEIDLAPAKPIRLCAPRPKCACRSREGGVTIALMPPRPMPQSRLGLGPGVDVLVSLFDDRFSFHRLRQQVGKRHRTVILRQQMVQWTPYLANWLRSLCDAMWNGMLASSYLQVDEIIVKMLHPNVEREARTMGLGDEARKVLRQVMLLPILEHIKAYLEREQPTVLPESPEGTAISYI